jgi:hypothetical protein
MPLTLLTPGVIPQGSGYHQFADNRSLFGIAKGMDVLSNLPSISKIAELLDEQIFRLLHVMSGRTIKHVLAAAGTCCILSTLHKRRSQLF